MIKQKLKMLKKHKNLMVKGFQDIINLKLFFEKNYRFIVTYCFSLKTKTT